MSALNIIKPVILEYLLSDTLVKRSLGHQAQNFDLPSKTS